MGKKYLAIEECDKDGLAYALEVARGQKSNRLTRRKAAENIWLAISEGKASAFTILTWCEFVARQIVPNLIPGSTKNDRLRPQLALNSIGLSERDDKNREMRSLISDYLDLTSATSADPDQVPPSPTKIAKFLKARGYLANLKARDAAKVVTRELAKIPRR
jgi:hypothetical protein